MKGLIAHILTPSYGNCSNGGISSKCETVIIVGNGGNFEVDDSRPAVRIIHRVINGKDYYHAEPVEKKPNGTNGYMFGGCYITGDSSFPFDHPIKLHDRVEYPA